MFQFLGSYSPGAFLLKARQTFGHGLRVAYYRDIVRPRIVNRTPVHGLTDARCEIHVLTSKNDWLTLLWGLHSFFSVTDHRFRLCIHEDGSLPEEAVDTLRKHFPDGRVIRRTEADALAKSRLKDHPRCRAFRNFHPLALKVFDFNFFLESDRMFILDSDILFFQEPVALLSTLLDDGQRANALNLDWDYGYSLPEERIRGRLSAYPFIPRINSGLGLIHKESIPLDWAEEILDDPDIFNRPHCVEQTIIALCSARHGFTPLPDEYSVRLKARDAEPVKHYTSPIRHLLYGQGIADLLNELL